MTRYFGQLLLVGALVAMGWIQAAWSQDLIGVLPEVLKPEVAERLKLSDEQRAKLSELVKRRNSDAIGLAQQLREVPPDQKESLRNSFRVESERLALEMLSPEQRETFEQVRVNRLGLLSLSEPDIGKKLNLADWQMAKVAELTAKANAASRSANAERVRAEVERSLRSEISDSQWAAWQVLSGRSPGKDLGSPQPPERKTPAPMVAQVASSGPGGEPGKAVSADRLPVSEVQLQMNFQATPWPEVLKWLCEQADLSLQADAMPTGSFTYRDNSRKYSIGEALDIMSASLLNKGYSLLRRQRLLMVVDLESPMVENMIGELAEFVTPEQLDKRGDFELVKCLFYLSRMNPDEAKKEVEQLLSLQGSVISLPSAGQIQVTDTAGVLRAVQALIKRAEDPESMRGSSIIAIPLKHITANEVLDVARPLLNLPEGVNSNQEISLSTDTFGNTIFVNAKKTEDVQKLRDLVQHLDMAPSASEQVGGTRELPIVQIHEIKGSDPDLAFRVLSQRLSSETDVRMELDKETSKLVVQARPTTHKEIDEVLAMLGGQSSSFEVIDLKNLDTQLAIATIKKFFGLTDTGSAAAGQPIIDGDLLMRRLYVKAEPKQLEQIRTLIEKLEMNSASSNLGDNVRMIPLPTRKFDRTIEQIEQLWQATKKRNRLRVVAPGELMGESALPQKAISPDERDRLRRAPEGASGEAAPKAKPDADAGAKPVNPAPKEEATRPQARARRTAAKLVSLAGDDTNQVEPNQVPLGNGVGEAQASGGSASQAGVAAADEGQGDDIVIMQGPGGLIVTSNDSAALAEFDKLLRLLLEQSAAGNSEPNFYWLKYRTAAAAKELLESILSGSTSSGSGGGGGGLIGDMVSEVGGGLLGSLLGGGGGGISSSGASLTTGDVLINADPTLNALIIRANPLDLELCEQLLRVIDQPDSPISVRTRGVIDVIPVLSQDADAVAAMVRGLFGDRIEGGGGGGGGGSQPRAPDPRELIQALTGGGGSRRGGGSSQLSPPKIAVSVDKNTNSLIVMAQPQDIEMIRELVESLDVAGGDVEEQVTVVSLKDTNLNVDMIGSALKGVLGAKAKTSNTASNSSSSGSSQGASSSGGGDADQARRTAEFIQQMRERMQGGGGGPGGSSSGRPSFSPFGGGGFPFGGGRGGPPSGGSGSSQGGRGGR